jgi:hypothetical protein
MQVVTTRDPSKPARRLIGGSPGERAELVEGDHRFWIVWSALVRSQPRRFLPPELCPERKGPCTSTLRFEWVILSLPPPRHTPTLVAGVRN